MPRRLLALACALLAIGLATAGAAQALPAPVAGTADPSFADPGLGSVSAIAVQPDGKILVGGSFEGYTGGTASSYDGIARLNADGTVDTSFVNPHLGRWGGGPGHVNSIGLLPDGRIVAGGAIESANSGATTRYGVVLLHADGSFDASFDADISASGTVSAVGVRPDGTILLGGPFLTNGGRQYFTAVDATGAPTPTGFVLDPSNYVFAISVAADGSFAIGGRFTTVKDAGGVSQPHLRVARIGADGNLDGAFGDTSSVDNQVLAVAVQGAKIIAGGEFTGFLTRFNADGSVDGSFADPALDAKVRAITVQPDGKVLIGGDFSTVGGDATRGHLTRLNADGTVDSTFAASNVNSTVLAVTLQPDGKALIGGSFNGVDGLTMNAAARLFATGPIAAPTAVTATAGMQEATVSWTAVPGGITSSTVTSAPGGKTCTATAPATSCAVTGLTAGTSYTFTVTAANTFGDGPASDSSNAVVPTAPAAGKAKVRIRSARARTGAVVLRIGVNMPGRLSVVGSADGDVVCRGARHVAAAGTTTLVCSITRSGRRLLARRSADVLIAVRFKASGKAAAYATRTVRVPHVAPAPAPVTG